MRRFTLLMISVLLTSFVCIGQVMLYTDCNYRGQSANVGPGNYYNSVQFAVADRSISSIKIPPGYRVEIYPAINMGGAPYVITSSIPCLKYGVNNTARSMRITYSNTMPGDHFNPYGGASVYTACNYTGRYAYLPPGDYPQLHTIIGNNAISSLRIPDGMVMELYKDENFQGISTGKITAATDCLGNYWNNSASSARVYYNSGGWIPPTEPPPIANNGAVTIYRGCNYFGQAQHFNQGNFADLKPSLGNRPAGSIMIPDGLTVELYSNRNFGGYLMGKYNSNKSCLQSSIQYGAASMKVYRSSGNSSGGSAAANGVLIYTNCNFSGRNASLSTGNYYNLNSNGNFSPSSLRVPPGFDITLYTEANMRGTSSGKINSDMNCLGDWLRGKARSAVVTRRPLPAPEPR